MERRGYCIRNAPRIKYTYFVIAPLEVDDNTSIGAILLFYLCQTDHLSVTDKDLLELIAANVSTVIGPQLEREARAHQDRLKMIGGLFSGFLQDLKTPLSIIQGYTQQLQETDERKIWKQYSKLIYQQIEHLKTM
ncbi:histidine kinase dimerization/phospho-acceptor domain-containing protein [Pajaroellobacter abortibovis]|uniref:histidine kinase n=1 Tax=Pajaroellobacter abortibovis TaxID=1882918 RepID=A0A1L6MYE6_9BACT|nr:histidine kinase dimerization/phospho-acceptor domain-containing protein [Pajaroellobacter abortibovis]APS00591.1 hypothetical protein BCY86_07835 [Pajaroellobacter abortibovis]